MKDDFGADGSSDDSDEGSEDVGDDDDEMDVADSDNSNVGGDEEGSETEEVWMLTVGADVGGYCGGSLTAVQAWQPCPLWESSPC